MLENNSNRLIGSAIAIVVAGSLLGVVHAAAPQQVNSIVDHIQKTITGQSNDSNDITEGKSYVGNDNNAYVVNSDGTATFTGFGKDAESSTTLTVPSSVTINSKKLAVRSLNTSLFAKPTNDKSFDLASIDDETNLVVSPGVITIDGADRIYTDNDKKIAIKSLTIPDTVTKIAPYAFMDVFQGTTLNIPKSVTEIGEGAFGNEDSNGNLQSLTFENGSNISSIDKIAFYGHKNLTSISLPDGLKTIGESAFMNHSANLNIYIPDSVTSIGDNAFTYTREHLNSTDTSIYSVSKNTTYSKNTFSTQFNGDSTNPRAEMDSSGNSIYRENQNITIR